MTEETALDRAHAQMIARSDDDNARLQFFERLIDAELFLLLETESDGDAISPQTFSVEGAKFVLVFDSELRLGEFANKGAAFVALSGRALVQMLAGQELGLGVNLQVAPSEFLLPAEGVAWLLQTLAANPVTADETPVAFAPPRGVPEMLLSALDKKLATAQGLAKSAYLVEVTYAGGQSNHLLAFENALEGAHTALATAMNEALIFCGLDAGSMDITFLDTASSGMKQIAAHGLRFDLPHPVEAKSFTPSAPGMDPDKPPKLR